ncbi:class I SAM-dependent methyltransferase [Methanocella sp. MCL-LM]|uniref:class I SAM-dependent methyltransferase n=1 Tax=Methanocella sp. MCL-LM TaxID=3412035 RepID=UPI003C727C8C
METGGSLIILTGNACMTGIITPRMTDMLNLDWKALWNAAQQGSLMDKSQPDEDKWLAFWDGEAAAYLARVKAEERVYAGIVEYLRREGVFREGDRVLDIACGPGTYTLQFAPMAQEATALDISGRMLAELVKEACERRIGNIRPVQSAWSDYREPEKYDLVFTALSPAVTGPGEFLKMEAFSSRSCCYVTTGTEEQSRTRHDLWRILAGVEKGRKEFNIAYPFNLLVSMGRKPNVRFFDYRSGERMTVEQLTEYYAKFFGNFMEIDEEKRARIAAYMQSISSGGYCDSWNKKSLVALYWDVP